LDVNVTRPRDLDRARATPLLGEAWLAEQPDPVLLVDPATHRLSACNAAGAACLGLGDARTLDLDPSMPGWGPIESQALLGPQAAPREDTILFWTPAGPKAVTARLEAVRHEGRALVMIVIGPRASALMLDADPLPAPGPQDDLATLREIARRIRAGILSVQAPAAVETSRVDEKTIEPLVESCLASSTGKPAIQFPPPLKFEQLAFPFGDEEAGATPALQPSQTAKKRVRRDRVNGPSALATLAHELRTPLSAIVSLAEIMRDERLGAMGNARYKAYAGDIHDSARHTLDLVHAMVEGERDAARGKGNHRDFDEVDLNAIARSCGLAMQPIAARVGVEIETDLLPSLPPVLANARAIRQMIFNLLSNALRYTPHGGLIKIVTRAVAGQKVQLEVTDSGSGMSQADIARILAPAGTNRANMASLNGNGSGIGLPLVRQLADAHGAVLEIKSDPETGTQVTITFANNTVILS
jgi:two-component system, cell cycle sensor histidine kinase PleC